ncbi:MAG: Gfo/Idh/MocA family oxidoreductase [Endomicrobia bacterium]|nr:Gfo/Idh/MocA family oxidoreductase [Endomicrobiia bacterium]
MRQYSVVVAGLGKRGKHHCSAFYKNPRFKLIGVCDIDKNKLQEIKTEFNVPEADTNISSLLRKIKPDIFCFCTMPDLRLEMIQHAVENQVKLIAFEKPLRFKF